MTNEEINEAVAVTVMGEKPEGFPSICIAEHHNMDGSEEGEWCYTCVKLSSETKRVAWSYSTDLVQAFEMEEKIKADGNELRYSRLLIMCISEIAPIENIIWEAAHASPLARCRAALKVYGVGG